MQTLPLRQMDIVEIARRDGRVTVDSLANRFNVTPQTIRKDLGELCDLEVLRRLAAIHGNVYTTETAVNEQAGIPLL